MHHLGSNVESFVYQGLKFHRNSCLTDTKIPMIRENDAMVLNATLVDGQDMTCDFVVPVVPTEVPAVEHMVKN